MYFESLSIFHAIAMRGQCRPLTGFAPNIQTSLYLSYSIYVTNVSSILIFFQSCG